MDAHFSALFTTESSPPGPLGEAQSQLRDRMLRDAILEVLRNSFKPSGGEAVSLVEAGLVRDVTVTGDRVRVEVPLPSEWSPLAGPLVTEIQRRVQALPEVTVTEIAVISGC